MWDVLQGRCVEWVRFPSGLTSMSVSPTDEFLLTAHAHSLGLAMWADRSVLAPVTISEVWTIHTCMAYTYIHIMTDDRSPGPL